MAFNQQLSVFGQVAPATTGTAGQVLVSAGSSASSYWASAIPVSAYSAQFNGSNYSSFTDSTLLSFGTGDFTVECWVYKTSAINGAIIDARTTLTAIPWGAYIDASNFPYFYIGSPLTSSIAITNNAWNHVVWTKISGVFKIYVNGVQGYSAALATNLDRSGTVTIGGTAAYTTGYISNLRVVKGVGVYTGAFTVPTSPLQTTQAAGTNIAAITGTQTSLLTCNSLTLTDSSPNLIVLTNSGVVASATSNPPFTSTTVSIPTASLTAVNQQFTGDGSTNTFSVAGGYTPNAIAVYYNGLKLRNGSDVTVTNGSTVVFAIAPQIGAMLDVVASVPTTYSSITPVSYSVGFSGSSQYLTLASNAAFTFGTGDFTIEGWYYLTAAASTTKYLFDGRSGGGNQAAPALFITSSAFSYYVNGAQAAGAGTPVSNSWFHMALVRISGITKLYVNGQQIFSYSDSVNYTSSTMRIGSEWSAAGLYDWQGYISNLRIVKGVGVYTGAFTPPQTPLAIVQSAVSPSIQAITGTQTSLLTCNAPTIIDGSTNAFTITNNGSAPVSTAIVPTFTNVTINNPSLSTYQAAYLVVAGGGGGGFPAGGGGGAGGLLTNSTLLTIGTTYTITVGAGGNGGLVSGGVIPTIGTNSVMSGAGLTTITAFGGGGGGSGGVSTGIGSSGGSGGGAGNNGSAASGSTGTSGQGFAGGNNAGASPYPSGGGGGAGAAGSNASGSASGAGGAGVSSSITGSSVTYAGGGGGAGTSQGASAGAGGVGGGGAGGGAGVAGTTNTGGGGGGASNAAAYNGGAGGSGVVIIAVPYANYTGTTTGSPTVTTVTSFSGTYKILTFTASGSYTA